ncbi:YuzF family protein [Psychrobacillus soli]|uniref:YuzF family protein n=1 Tax=Psychrobacillus soli TaxID=1543965 RepID=UPI001FEBC03B|nr:YuzF family protein [Psychrobacillus soli]
MNTNPQSSVEFVSSFEPYLYHLLQTLSGKRVAVQTSTNNTIQGNLTMVAPDHIVVEVSGSPFYIRNQEIVWVTLSR